MINKIILLIICISIAWSCSTYKNPDYIIHCIKNDPSSVRIIPKRDPFTPRIDLINKNLKAATSKLLGYEANISLENRKDFSDKIKDLENSAFIDLTIVKASYLAFRQEPCSKEATLQYNKTMDSLNHKLINLEILNKDMDKILNSKNLGGKSEESILKEITKYINKIKY